MGDNKLQRIRKGGTVNDNDQYNKWEQTATSENHCTKNEAFH